MKSQTILTLAPGGRPGDSIAFIDNGVAALVIQVCPLPLIPHPSTRNPKPGILNPKFNPKAET
jgi:hypothetical protein